MNQSAKYRQTASECYEAARILFDPCEKAKLLAMAQLWILLAGQAERNIHLKAADTGLTGMETDPVLCRARIARSLEGQQSKG